MSAELNPTRVSYSPSPVITFLAIVTTLLCVGVTPSHSVAAAQPRPITAPTRTHYQLNGRTISMPCQGSGRVAVIFLAGGIDPASTWNPIVEALGENVLTCKFDRPGVGASDPAPTPLTPRAVAHTLHRTLRQARIGHRFVLVAHSLAGPTAIVFGATYPRQVAGAVLIDPTTPDTFTRDAPTAAALGYDPAASATQTAAVTRWPTVPLTVLSHDPAVFVGSGAFTPAIQAAWEAAHQAYAHLSRTGTHYDVPGSGHYIYRDHQSVVVNTIRRTVQNAGLSR
jgi:pimeloyl-ACP methyl ester carboxylesterase